MPDSDSKAFGGDKNLKQFRVFPMSQVVKKIESYGSESGKTTSKIVITDCGQLN